MNLKNKIFPFLIAFSALSVSASAAFYSVSGLSKLFAGASLEVIIMASSLEIAKLVIASLLYQYWDTINKGLRAYLTVAAGVLILITSMGIYGFLSAAYQETANKAGNIDAQVSLIEVKRDNIKEQLAVYNAEKESINAAVSNLRSGLAGNIQTYKDKDGNILSTSSSANRKSLERQLDQAISRQSDLNSKVDELNTKLFEYETEIVEVKTNSELAGELGPLKYLSGLTGVPMDKIINILLLVIIFVFDPLAIALVIAANFAFAKLRTHDALNELTKIQEEEGLYDNEGSDIYTEEDLSDWDSTLNDGLEDLPWEENKPEGIPVYFDPKTGRPYIIEEIEEDEEPEEEDEDLIEESNQLEMEFPPHESKPSLSEEEKQYDLNNDGVLDEQEKAKLEEDKLLNNPGISSWRKKKLKDYLEGRTKRYF
jgi:Skp family chaperone for outer membrane proteins